MGIVVASELPRRRSTILVRIMAGGAVLPSALADLSALPDDAHEHAMALPILLGLQHALGSKPKRTAEEQEFIVSMQNIVEKLRAEGRKEGLREGRDEGLREGGQAHARAMLRRVLAMRKLAPSRRDEARIDRCDDLDTLDRWIERALIARTIDEAFQMSPAPARRRRAVRAS